jgi:DNA polymerase-1
VTQAPYNFDAACQWEIVSTGERLEQVVREIADQRIFSWDLEGSGLNPWKGARLVGHAFAWNGGGRLRSCYIPCRHKPLPNELFQEVGQLEPEIVTTAVKPLLEGPAAKVAHNIVFDIHLAEPEGIAVTPTYIDTLTACRLIDERWYNHKLETCLIKSGVPHDPDWKRSIKPQIKERSRQMRMSPTEWVGAFGYQYLTIPVAGRYACQDAVYELLLSEWAVPQQAAWQNTWDLEMNLLPVILEMESVGVPVDTGMLIQLAEKERARMADIEPQIFALAGCEFELSNDNQMRKVLYSKLGLAVPNRTPDGEPSVDDDALFQLEKGGATIAPLIRKWNKSQKIVTTYTMSIVEKVDAHGILHGQVDPGGAKTGRFSMRQPNLQNIPIRTKIGRQVREAFRARPGMLRYCIDYSQIELRMLAHLSQDPLLLKIYREGLDAHRMTAIEAFGSADTVDGIDMRRVGKIANFGATYGMTYMGMLAFANKDLPEGVRQISEPEAKDFMNRWNTRYRGVRAFENYLCYKIASAPGHEFRNMWGRPQRMGAGFDPGAPGWKRRKEERQAMSRMISGSAADLVKQCMVASHRFIRSQADCEAYLVLMVHDDLQFDMGIDGSAKTVREIRRLMESTCQHALTVPIVADVEWFSTNWATKHKMSL